MEQALVTTNKVWCSILVLLCLKSLLESNHVLFKPAHFLVR